MNNLVGTILRLHKSELFTNGVCCFQRAQLKRKVGEYECNKDGFRGILFILFKEEQALRLRDIGLFSAQQAYLTVVRIGKIGC